MGRKRKYTLEELYLIGDFPIEVVRDFIFPLYEPFKKEAKKRDEYPGVSVMAAYYGVNERFTRYILKRERKGVHIDYCDKLTTHPYVPFTLNDITDASIEWAKKTGSDWPIGYEPRQRKSPVKK